MAAIVDDDKDYSDDGRECWVCSPASSQDSPSRGQLVVTDWISSLLVANNKSLVFQCQLRLSGDKQ